MLTENFFSCQNQNQKTKKIKIFLVIKLPLNDEHLFAYKAMNLSFTFKDLTFWLFWFEKPVILGVWILSMCNFKVLLNNIWVS